MFKARPYDRTLSIPHGQDYLADGLALQQKAQGIGSPIHGQDVRHAGLELSLREPLEQLFKILPVDFRFSEQSTAPEHADDLAVLVHDPVNSHLGSASARESDYQQAAVPVDATHGLVKGIPADRVVDQTDRDPGPRSLTQGFGKPRAGRVRLEDVGLEIEVRFALAMAASMAG